jgi:hypothetical protein
MAKKKPTEQELKDRYWKMVKETDLVSGDAVEDHPDFKSWYDGYVSITPKIMVAVPTFKATLADVRKIRDEIDNSCLTIECKKSLLKALKAAK